jgi:hypothetical protein
MKNYLLWLLVIIVVLQAYNAIETSPDFHTLSHDDYLKEIQENSKLTNPPQGIGNLEVNEYFNGRYGKYLVNCTLISDAAMLFLLVVAIRKNPRKTKD